MHIDMGAVEHDLARLQSRAFDKPQRGDCFAAVARNLGKVVLEIVAPIAGAEVAVGQEAEIVIVRHSDRKGRLAARADHVLLGRGPDIGADEKAAAWRDQHDHLRAVCATRCLVAVALGELVDQDVAQKGLVIAQPPEPARGVIKAGIVMRIEPCRSDTRGGFIKRCNARVLDFDDLRHQCSSASSG